MKKVKVELKSSISGNNTMAKSEYSWLIVANGEEVGFANLIRENFDDDFLVLDMGIKEEYKNKRIRKQAVNKISELNIEDFIIMKNRDSYLAITH